MNDLGAVLLADGPHASLRDQGSRISGTSHESHRPHNPHNPTGRVFRIDELEALAEIARRHNLLVFTDEIYVVRLEHKDIVPRFDQGEKRRRHGLGGAAGHDNLLARMGHLRDAGCRLRRESHPEFA